MKKSKKLLAAFALSLMFVGASTVAASADTVIQVEKEYNINLDGKGKKENIYIKKLENKEDDWCGFELYINERLVKKIDGFYSAKCKVIDIQKNKKGKEIVFTGSGASSGHGNTFGIFKYQNGKLKKLIGSKFKTYNVSRVPEVRTNGTGKVFMMADTPIELGNGCYYGELVFKMKNGKLKLVNKNTITLSEESQEYDYKVNKKIKVYKKASNKSKVVDTLKIRETINIIKIKFRDVDNDDWPYEADTAYAYIKDKNGNKGWIKLDEYDWEDNDNQFVEYPAWG